MITLFYFHAVVHINGINAKTECRYKFGVLYFRFVLTLLIKQKRILQKESSNPFNIRPLEFHFFESFGNIE